VTAGQRLAILEAMKMEHTLTAARDGVVAEVLVASGRAGRGRGGHRAAGGGGMIRLHHVAQARSFRILWLMEEMGLEFEVVRRSFFDKSLRSPEYLAISPAGRVPALEIDGRVIYESGAITEYLCATRGALGRAQGDAEWVDWLEWLHFAETIGQHLANLTQQHIALREDWMRSPTVDAARGEAAREGARGRGAWPRRAGLAVAVGVLGGRLRGGIRRDDRAAVRGVRGAAAGGGLASPQRGAAGVPARGGAGRGGRDLPAGLLCGAGGVGGAPLPAPPTGWKVRGRRGGAGRVRVNG
jgi:hypothetical protein